MARFQMIHHHAATLILVGFLVGVIGCGGKKEASRTSDSNGDSDRSSAARQSETSNSATSGNSAEARTKPKVKHNPAAKEIKPPEPQVHERATLANLVEQAARENDPEVRAADTQRAIAAGFQIANARAEKAASFGLRKLESKSLVLITDLPSQPDVDELPRVFDLAVSQWAEYFEIAADRVATWRMVGYLMQDKQRFVNAGALTSDLPDFPHGWARGFELWLYEQPSAYYRRHLLLHEGTHAFMSQWLHGVGPPWYAEGMAELLATHRWHENTLTMRYFPKNRDEVPHWGRVKIIRDDFAARKAKRLEQVMQYGPRDHFQVEPYGWCWGACAFFDRHPRYASQFRELKKNAREIGEGFSRKFQESFGAEWRNVSEEWQLFVANIDYGYDVARAAIERRPVTPIPADGGSVKVAADRGWQSSGLRIEAGKKYRITASGKYQLAEQPKPWWSEPNGVTIRYHQSRPLGMLLGAVVEDDQPLNGLSPLAVPDPIGQRTEFTAQRSGTLYLRINESFGELSDNAGEIVVRVMPN